MTTPAAPAVFYRSADQLPLGELQTRDHGRIAVVAGEVTRTVDEAGNATYTALAYDTSASDLHGTGIDPAAFRSLPMLPVLLWHDRASFPVGKVTGWTPSESGPVAHFAFHALTGSAREANALVDAGMLDGVSIGFLGYAAEDRDGVPTYTDVELIEISLTPVPSSRGARISVARAEDVAPAEDTEDAPAVPAEPVEAAAEQPAAEVELEAPAAPASPTDEAATVSAEAELRQLRLARLKRNR